MNRRVVNNLLACVACAVVGLAFGWAGGDDGNEVGGVPVFWLCVALSFAINWIAYVPSYLAHTEHYYDLTGSFTYLTLTAFALIASDLDARSVILALMVVVWALRLGTFLFRRVRRAGSDSRFDKVKYRWAQFLMYWSLQALWVVFTLAASLAAITSGHKQALGIIGIIGIIVWVVGFAIEVVSDSQKSAFRSDPANKGRYITSGLWAWSRHPNYFGEFTLWVGAALLAFPALHGWQYLTLISPVFIWVLLNKMSGVPALEKSADERWGGEAAYEQYKAQTPVFWLRPPRRT